MASLDGFARRMDRLSVRVADNADKMVRRVVLVVDQAVVSETPIDTGSARSNWIVKSGSPSARTIKAYSPGTKGSTEAANVAGALQQAQAVVANYKGNVAIHITNNLDYIEALNNGTSRQASANYVEVATQVAVLAVKQANLTGR